MTTPLDRAAKAIEAADEDELLPPLVLGVQRKFAIAALGETREPTPEMIEAGCAELSHYRYDKGNEEETVVSLFTAMHDALMKE
jgi:hypothetical protein